MTIFMIFYQISTQNVSLENIAKFETIMLKPFIILIKKLIKINPK